MRDRKLRTRKILARSLFWLLLVSTLILDWAPHAADTWRDDNDPNFMTFGVMTVLMRCSYNEISDLRVFIFLGSLGGLIELVQLAPILHRYSDMLDWAVDIGAIISGLSVFWAFRRLSAAFSLDLNESS